MKTQRILGIGITGVLFACAAAAVFTQSAAAASGPLVLYVDDDVVPGGNGSASYPFHNIPEAVASARTQVSSNRGIEIRVAPGTYAIADTLRIDFPVHLIGSNVPETFEGWPSASAQSGTETVIVAACDDGTADFPLVTIGSETGEDVKDVAVENFTLHGNNTTCSVDQGQHAMVQAQFVRDLSIASNIALGPGDTGIDVAASSGSIVANYVSDTKNCGICIASGTPGSPAKMTLADNRSEKNGAGGLLLSGTAFPVDDSGNGLVATVRHNDLSMNQQGKLGFGLRVLAIGRMAPDTKTVKGSVAATIIDNRIADNVNDIVLDAGFPTRQLESICDDRLFTAALDLTLSGNDIQPSESSQPLALVTFTRAQHLTNKQKNPLSDWQYLHKAEFAITDPDLSLGEFEPDHPLLDPYPSAGDPYVPGACEADITNEALENRLIYNRVEILPTY